MIIYAQDRDARLPYAVDWTDFLANAVGDTIATQEWLAATPVTDPVLLIEDEGLVDGQHNAFLSGGVLGITYRVTSRVTTAQGRTSDQSFGVFIKEA